MLKTFQSGKGKDAPVRSFIFNVWIFVRMYTKFIMFQANFTSSSSILIFVVCIVEIEMEVRHPRPPAEGAAFRPGRLQSNGVGCRTRQVPIAHRSCYGENQPPDGGPALEYDRQGLNLTIFHASAHLNVVQLYICILYGKCQIKKSTLTHARRIYNSKV